LGVIEERLQPFLEGFLQVAADHLGPMLHCSTFPAKSGHRRAGQPGSRGERGNLGASGKLGLFSGFGVECGQVDGRRSRVQGETCRRQGSKLGRP